MKRLVLLITVISFLAGAVWAQKAKKDSKESMESSLMTMEKKAWEAWSKKDGKFFEAFLADEAAILSGSGFSTKAESVKEIAAHNCVVNNYSMNNFKVTMLNKDTALVTYEAMLDGKCGEQTLPAKAYASTVYVKRGDKWVGAFHQETPAMAMDQPN